MVCSPPAARAARAFRFELEAGRVRAVFFAMYCVMAFWMLVAAVLRVTLSLRAGVSLDVLPGVTGALGLFALVAAIPRVVRRVRGRQKPFTGELVEVPHENPSTEGPFGRN